MPKYRLDFDAEIAKEFVPRLNKFQGFNILEDYDVIAVKITFNSDLYTGNVGEVLDVFTEMIEAGAVVVGWGDVT